MAARMAALTALAALQACRPGADREAAAPGGLLRVFVSIPPELEFVQRIGGDRVTVESFIGQGQNFHVFQPTPRQMDRLAGADCYFAIGVPFEAILGERLTQANPHMQYTDLSAGLPRLAMRGRDEDDPTSRSGEADPHIWMDPGLVKTMVQRLARALIAADPAGRAVYEANLKEYLAALDGADREVRALLAGLRARKFIVYHPAFGYFARAYGLEQIPIEVEGKSPEARAMATTIDAARAAGAHVIFVEPQFSPRGAQAVAEAIGGRVEVANDLAPDYLANLLRLAHAIADAGPK